MTERGAGPGEERPGEKRPGEAPGGPVVYKFGGSSVADAERIGRVAELVARGPDELVVVVSALGETTDVLARLAESLGDAERVAGMAAEVELLRGRHREVIQALGRGSEGTEALLAEIERLTVEALGEGGGGEAVGAGSEVAGGPEPGTGAPEADADALRSDRVLALGEDLAARIVAEAIRATGRKAEFVDARTVVRTAPGAGRARPDEAEVRRLAHEVLGPLLERGVVPVVQGFVGATAEGVTTTLGRGGSDYTAALLGAALDSPEVHVWTDVRGLLSGDPGSVDHPRLLREIGFEEAVELAHFGARVIHPAAAKHAVARRVPLRIRSTFEPDDPGTTILPDLRDAPGIAAVAFQDPVTLIKVRSHPTALPYGFLARVFGVLARHGLPVDLVATSHSSTAFTLDVLEDLSAVERELSEFSDVEVVRDVTTVTVVGHGLMEEPGIDALVFGVVGHTPVHLISQASDVSLSLVVDREAARPLVRKLHRALIEESGEIEVGLGHVRRERPRRDDDTRGRTA